MKVSGIFLTFVLLASTVVSASGMRRRGQNKWFSLPFPIVGGEGGRFEGERICDSFFFLEERTG